MQTAGTRFWVLLATVLGSSLVFLDGTVVGLALPTMQEQFRASASDAQWIVEAYTIALGALMLFGGALADRYGRRRIFLTGTVIFTLASVACGLSTSMPMAIAARVVQGIGGMLLAPASLAILGSHFTGAERGKAVGTWSALTAVASSAGPVLGGALIDHLGWRSVFFINVPLAAVVLVATLRCVDESRDERDRGRLDVLGSLLITVALAGIVYALLVAPVFGWHAPRVYGALVGGIAALLAFLVVESRAESPIMPLELFRSSTFSGVNVLTLLLYAGLSGLFYYLPFTMIQVYGYSATVAGATMLPFVAILFLLSRPMGGLVARIGPRPILTVGPIVAGAGFLAVGLLQHNGYWASFLPAMFVLGIGMGITVAPLTTTVMDAVDRERIGIASGINNAVSRIAAMLAIAVMGAVIWHAFNASLDRRAAAAHVSAADRGRLDAQRERLAGARMSDPRLQQLIRDAYADGFTDVTLWCAGLAIASSIVAAAAIRRTTT